ncbi:MAG: XisH family protein [Scytolyngbya sp. HA4215-MV1]|nr:XisH family protein [Scytolyngbya sp. HA4215-MV1]
MFHGTIRRVLEKEGWTITDDPCFIHFGEIERSRVLPDTDIVLAFRSSFKRQFTCVSINSLFRLLQASSIFFQTNVNPTTGAIRLGPVFVSGHCKALLIENALIVRSTVSKWVCARLKPTNTLGLLQ